MTQGLTRGAYTGRETKLYRNSGSYEAPAWTEMKRVRNVTVTDGPALSEVEFHGAQSTGNIPGYDQFSGSFEYVRRTGVDPDWDALVAARRQREIVDMRFNNGDIATSGTSGWRAPIMLGEFDQTDNGGDPSVVTIPFGKADAFDSRGSSVEVTYPQTS